MDRLYEAPVAGDRRQGDIYRDAISLSLTTNDPPALRTFQKGDRETVVRHEPNNPPKGGFKWNEREHVEAEAKKAYGIVLTHDCEIENDDDEHYRQVALVRPFSALENEDDRRSLLEHRHFGKLYLPAAMECGFPESYVDLRAITTLRRDALPEHHRVLGMSDNGRLLLQAAIAAYFTEASDEQANDSFMPVFLRQALR